MFFRKFKNKRISSVKFISLGLKGIFLTSLIICTTNFLVDPFYEWSIGKTINFKRKDYDERIQKTNYLANINSNYNALLLGNSRSTYLDVRKFDLGVNIFNYSVNAMSIYEYDQLIHNFVQLTGEETKVILMGIDPHNLKGDKIEKLKIILDESTSKIKKIKNLLSIDMFRFSLETIAKTIQVELQLKDRKQRYYDNQLIKGNERQNIVSNEKYIKIENEDITYNVDFTLLEEYRKLKNKYPNSKFIIYFLPFHGELITKWETDLNFDEKNRKFISEIINIFGEIYYFNYKNEYNSSFTNYYDTYHFYPYFGDIIINNMNKLYLDKKSNLGYLLNKENYNSFILNKKYLNVINQ